MELNYLWVAIGSALGGTARYWLGGTVARLAGTGFPWGTILINIIGSAVIGAAGRLVVRDPDRYALVQSFVMVGLCGGFTTFSAFSLQTFELLRNGTPGLALGNVAISVVACLVATWVGWSAAG